MSALLDVAGLTVTFGRVDAPFIAVDALDLTVEAGEVVGIVGESGSGKSVTSLAVMGLIDFPGRVEAAHIRFDGIDLQALGPRQRRRVIGKDIAMIFQEPMSSLNPCFTVGFQITETLKTHLGGTRESRRHRALELLDLVGIPDPKARLGNFPHQLSGGMSQRVMIAMAIACGPRLLIADEPTTALDVTIQAQIIDLLVRIQRETGMALILITHNLALVSQVADRLVVLYAGQVVETGPLPGIFDAPRHPYTEALLDSLPERAAGSARLTTIPGVVPGQHDRPAGCLLSPRCRYADEECRRRAPALEGPPGRRVRCFKPIVKDSVAA